VIVFCIILITALAFACGSTTHAFTARVFDETRACLGSDIVVDVIDGDDPGSCPPTCVTESGDHGELTTLITTTCGPYPPGVVVSGPRCVEARAAFDQNHFCSSLDGGSFVDAGPDAASGLDGGRD
jgi:hypothetical protein